MNQELLLGTYALKWFFIDTPEGKRSDWGKGVHGLLIYSGTGHMSVSINKDVENDPEQSASENLFDSILFYSGTYRVDGDLIRHQVTEASNPARIGKEMLRTAEIKGRELHLKTPVESFGQATLVWERV